MAGDIKQFCAALKKFEKRMHELGAKEWEQSSAQRAESANQHQQRLDTIKQQLAEMSSRLDGPSHLAPTMEEFQNLEKELASVRQQIDMQWDKTNKTGREMELIDPVWGEIILALKENMDYIFERTDLQGSLVLDDGMRKAAGGIVQQLDKLSALYQSKKGGFGQFTQQEMLGAIAEFKGVVEAEFELSAQARQRRGA